MDTMTMMMMMMMQGGGRRNNMLLPIMMMMMNQNGGTANPMGEMMTTTNMMYAMMPVSNVTRLLMGGPSAMALGSMMNPPKPRRRARRYGYSRPRRRSYRRY